MEDLVGGVLYLGVGILQVAAETAVIVGTTIASNNE
jgi:hypothetical protein